MQITLMKKNHCKYLCILSQRLGQGLYHIFVKNSPFAHSSWVSETDGFAVAYSERLLRYTC